MEAGWVVWVHCCVGAQWGLDRWGGTECIQQRACRWCVCVCVCVCDVSDAADPGSVASCEGLVAVSAQWQRRQIEVGGILSAL